jgi:hypothetical protein
MELRNNGTERRCNVELYADIRDAQGQSLVDPELSGEGLLSVFTHELRWLSTDSQVGCIRPGELGVAFGSLILLHDDDWDRSALVHSAITAEGPGSTTTYDVNLQMNITDEPMDADGRRGVAGEVHNVGDDDAHYIEGVCAYRGLTEALIAFDFLSFADISIPADATVGFTSDGSARPWVTATPELCFLNWYPMP